MKREEKIVKKGTFLYGGKTICKVEIIKTSMRRGTNDPCDLKEIREDKRGVFYFIRYTNPFGHGGETFEFDNLNDAIKNAEKTIKEIKWE